MTQPNPVQANGMKRWRIWKKPWKVSLSEHKRQQRWRMTSRHRRWIRSIVLINYLRACHTKRKINVYQEFFLRHDSINYWCKFLSGWWWKNAIIVSSLSRHSSSLDPNCGSSVPGSPRLSTRTTAHPIHSTPHPPPSTATTTTSTRLHPKKSSRPSLFERLFGFRSGSTMIESSSTPSPLITPLTVTWDSPDDLMPLTTSSAASSASGRASSSGYESLSNTAFDEVMHSYAEKPRSSRRTRDKTVWTSPMVSTLVHHPLSVIIDAYFRWKNVSIVNNVCRNWN